MGHRRRDRHGPGDCPGAGRGRRRCGGRIAAGGKRLAGGGLCGPARCCDIRRDPAGDRGARESAAFAAALDVREDRIGRRFSSRRRGGARADRHPGQCRRRLGAGGDGRSIDDETWASVLDINLNGAYRTIKRCFPAMIGTAAGAGSSTSPRRQRMVGYPRHSRLLRVQVGAARADPLRGARRRRARASPAMPSIRDRSAPR